MRFVTADRRHGQPLEQGGQGALTRHLLEHQTTDPRDLAGADIAGYRFDPSASTIHGRGGLVVFTAG